MFFSVLGIVTPVFALLGLGFAAMKLKWLPDGGHKALAQFAFNIAIPAMLFRAMLGAEPLAGSPLSLLAAYLIPVTCVWVMTSLLTIVLLKRTSEDQAGFSMAACFGNTVMLGIPISLMAFGDRAATPVAILISIEAVLLWIVATLQIEFTRRGGKVSFEALGGVLKELATNVVVVALILGMAGRGIGFALPGPVDRVFGLLGQAGVPVALFALGMALANFKIAGEKVTLGLLSGLKLAVLPAFAFLVANHLLHLPPLWIAVLTLHAAMPVGANPFIFATRYDRSPTTISAAIALSTLIAVLSVTGVIVVLKGALGV